MASKLNIAWRGVASVWVLFAVDVCSAQPEWELTTEDREVVNLCPDERDLPNIAKIVITDKNSVVYDYFKEGKEPFQVNLNWTDPLPRRVKLNGKVTMLCGAKLAGGKGGCGISIEHKVDVSSDNPEGRVIEMAPANAGISARTGQEYVGNAKFEKTFTDHDQDVVIRVYIGSRCDDGKWRVANYIYTRVDTPRNDAAAGSASGSAGPFAGKYDTTIGPMVIRTDGPWASGVIPNLQAGFNSHTSGNTLEGRWRSPNGTGTIRITLVSNGPAISGVITPDGSSTSNNFTGTAVAPGNPSEIGQPAKTDKLTFQAPELWVRPGDTVQAPIWLLNGNGLGAMNLVLHYDPAVVQPLSPAIKGNLVEGKIPLKINLTPSDAAGMIKVGSASDRRLEIPRLGTVAVVKFKVVGQVGQQCPLRPDVTTLNMGDDSKATAELIGGVVYVVSNTIRGASPGTPPPLPPRPTAFPTGGGAGGGRTGGGTGGGGTGNGGAGPGGSGVQPPAQPPVPPHTFLDAERALMMSVGLLETDLRYDVSGETAGSSADGKVTARDAQVIAKQAAEAVRRGSQ